MSDSAGAWKDFLRNWPDELPRRGLLITTFDEQISFADFLTNENFLLIQRVTPDAMGARTVVLCFDKVAALKITEVIKPKTFRAIGFEGSRKNV